MIPFIISFWAAVVVSIYSLEYALLHLRIQFVKRRTRIVSITPPGTEPAEMKTEPVVKIFRPFDRKPFNCETCLPFWLVALFLPFAIYTRYGVPIVAALALACTAGIITETILKAIRK